MGPFYFASLGIATFAHHSWGKVAREFVPQITRGLGTQLTAERGLCSSLLARAEPVLFEASLRAEFTGSSEQGLVG